MTTKAMHPQQIFNGAYIGLMRQAQKAVDEDGSCRYRIGELKCAIGMLISDEDYDESCEGLDVRNSYKVQEVAGITPATLKLARAIQTGHDAANATSGKDFVNELLAQAQIVAIAFDLEPNQVTYFAFDRMSELNNAKGE